MSVFKRIALGAILAAFAAPAAAQRAPVTLPARPAAGPPVSYTFPAVVTDSLPNGLRYALIESHELPIVSVRVVLPGVGPAGISYLDPAGKAGTTALTVVLMREGTTLRSSTQILDETADLGLDLIWPTGTLAPPYFRAGKSVWRASLDLTADLLINPSFPSDAFTRVQTNLATQADRLAATTQATRLMYVALFGDTSANARFSTATSFRGITRDEVIALHQQYFRPQNIAIVIGGDVTRAEAREALTKAFGEWKRGGTTVTPIVPAAPASPAPTTIYLKDSPGLAQTPILVARLVPGRDHPDGARLEALASLMGDAGANSGSRFYRALRTERGLAYGARMELGARPAGEMVTLAGATQIAPANADTAITTLLQVIRDVRSTKPILSTELDFSKQNLVGRIPYDMERIDVVAFQVSQFIRDRLPLDYINRWIPRLNELTLADVQATANKYLDPDHVAIIVVGDRAKIEAALRATGIPLVIVDK